ncbi:MAG TPA: biopolymer transporter ExbD [Cryomorphaceae bacterium]|jgi:biopolymer transport protein ExbD|nr:MAG: biopolymer transporter ExbD [Cryomorphaceae bacterium BACL7 MAG-120910-bin2]KRO68734.1 MAG: biopolymer transporter ExbD [Cryomorphaceae bacterium BACL7 MAG-120322-bin74]KRO84092.1 MAG: biopolymer transporter ExbD [Cryomorphaceae bacterium BACL7 MAG-121220-bin83]NQW25930.1 biopolymer transporter ExbD [Cryomorphaceae bacterium]HAB30924.1 biopolymer transporter ExbD [Cryomorphaceae bacterium]|tara:strand:+ start:2146 stop:2538 length:393 start_codon:yes stop_codon:yes gene_type:complete
MNLRNRNKVSAEFNMSSMTDMVFLLLIFFMLTSTLVTTSALDVILPKSKAQTVKKSTVTVTINPALQVSVNAHLVDPANLEMAILEGAASDPEAVIILRVDGKVPTEETVRIMDIAYRNRIKMVLATDPT